MYAQSVLAAVAMMAVPVCAGTAQQLFNFSSYVDIENSHLRPNGHLLLTTFDAGRLYTLDPTSAAPQAELISSLPGATALTGITAIGADKYAVIGGVRGSYMYTNITVYTVDFGADNGINATISISATAPDAVMLNGADSLPAYPHVILAADSRLARVWRIDTNAGTSEVAFADNATMAAPANSTIPIGINGLKVWNGYTYFTNTAKFLFARVPISDDGYATGDVEIIATLEDTTQDWDDFAIDPDTGDAYLTQASTAIARIRADGTQSIVYSSGDTATLLGPTSLTIPGDGIAYVTTRGGTLAGSTFQYSGQVVEVWL